MTSNDPNFPQDMPSVPESQEDLDGDSTAEVDPSPQGEHNAETAGAEAWSSERWTDATDSDNPDDIVPVQDGAIASDEGFEGKSSGEEPWNELDEAVSDPEVEVTTPATARPLTREPGAIETSQREAEKPVAANNNYDDWGEAEVPYQPKELGIIDQILLVLADGAVIWRKGLRWVRSQLPPPHGSGDCLTKS